MGEVKRGYVRPLDLKHGCVDLSHGAGGRAMAQLIAELFAKHLGNEYLGQGNDGAVLPAPTFGHRLVMSTDCHVVTPLFFAGGDIGCLSVHGTVNDVAVMGATPLYLAAGFILEEGFPLADLARIVESMAAAAGAAGVPVVTGDTKVVERGKGDGIFITTTGVGSLPPDRDIGGARVRAGDAILISGSLGDHGVAIMSQRENLSFDAPIESDTAALHGLIADLLATGADIRCLRDPTRGGLASTLNEIAGQSGVGLMLHEKQIPIKPVVNAACELLGLDPLYVANEGKLICICAAADAPRVLAAMKAHPLGQDAAQIGEAIADDHHFVQLATAFGGKRVVDWLAGDQLPRIRDGRHMRILLLTHAYNSLTQRLWAELTARGHDISIEFDIADSVAEEAVALFNPQLIIAPYLRRAIPQSIWSRHLCLIVHPGPLGDGGPSALDWTLQNGVAQWGVTVLQAEAEMDAGPVWASVDFPMRVAKKSSIYRNEVTEAASLAVLQAVERVQGGAFAPQRPEQLHWQPLMKQTDRRIDWQRDTTATVLARINAADGFPGVADTMFGAACHLFDACAETAMDLLSAPLAAEPGAIVGARETALLRATVDGGVWIGHVRRTDSIKLPATLAFAAEAAALPTLALPNGWWRAAGSTWQDIYYEEIDAVGFLHFDFYNGAMSTTQCGRLRDALAWAKARAVKVLVLMGGSDFWSNGIHLNVIEQASLSGGSAADESWHNINAMNDLALELIETPNQITIAALAGNTGAGGCFLARAADRLWVRDGVLMNPHYKNMGNLYGSEYWTYLLPRRVGAEAAAAIMRDREPLTAARSVASGFSDAMLAGDAQSFRVDVARRAAEMAHSKDFDQLIEQKRNMRAADEAAKPLARYREEELAMMQRNFYGFDPSYHVARHHFVRKSLASWTPRHLARHRDLGWVVPV